MSSNPIIRVHKDFNKWLCEKAEEIDIEKVSLTKMLELQLRNDNINIKGNLKKDKGKWEFELKTFK